jgi:uncharacterized protein YdcH (DUF465 family)
MKASVKVMLSYDYNHFEIALEDESSDATMRDVNNLRKQAQRLADEAVRQYKKAKEMAVKQAEIDAQRLRLEDEVSHIIATVPTAELTVEQKAKIKALEDTEYWEQFRYDCEDDEIM